jgi:hypothetical protein
LNEYQSIGELITDVGDYIEFYNHRRFHETLAYKLNIHLRLLLIIAVKITSLKA